MGGTIWYHMVPYCTIWYHMVPYGTIWYHMVPCDTILVPYGTSTIRFSMFSMLPDKSISHFSIFLFPLFFNSNLLYCTIFQFSTLSIARKTRVSLFFRCL